jgi:hypothetical protein
MIPGCRDVVVEKNSQNALLMLTKPMNTVGNVVGIKQKKNKPQSRDDRHKSSKDQSQL